MEDVLETYKLPYDRRFPVVCMDETSKQLVGEVRPPEEAEPGRVRRMDSEYERKGTCNLFLFFEPLRGWRRVRVSARRTRKDYAKCVRELVDVHDPKAKKIKLVQDNLNTHSGGSLYELYPPPETLRILNKVEFHYRLCPHPAFLLHLLLLLESERGGEIRAGEAEQGGG